MNSNTRVEMINVANRYFFEIKEIEQFVISAATQYELDGFASDSNGVEISDAEYDEAYRYIKKRLPDSPVLKGPSPSEHVTSAKVVVHNPPMTSVSKADGSCEEKLSIYHDWITDCSEKLNVNPNSLEIVESIKRDGIAIRVNYKNGVLHSAGLRPRDGIHGRDVTNYVKYISGVPGKLRLPLTLSLNGEIECWVRDFDYINQICEQNGQEPFKNPRNYTAGCMNRDDPEEIKHARLRVCFYSITGFDEYEKYYLTEIDQYNWVQSTEGLDFGSQRVDFATKCLHRFENLEVIEKESKSLHYYTDGIVLKINDISYQNRLGHAGNDNTNNPKYMLAWKFLEETAEAEVSSHEWETSRTGRIVPTAIFDVPFVLADTENSRATCNNYGWVKNQGIGIGAIVICKKGGKIIPNIMGVAKRSFNFSFPDKCPSCGGEVAIKAGVGNSEDLICTNPDCEAKQIKSWLFFLQQIGGKGIGVSTMEKIYKTGKVHKISDLYNLQLEDLLSVGLGLRQSLLVLGTIFLVDPIEDNSKMEQAILASKNKVFKIEYWKFFASLGIAGAGESSGKVISKIYPEFNSLFSIDAAGFESISGIGKVTANAIVRYLSKHKETILELLKRFELIVPENGKFHQVNFCLTGNFKLGKQYYKSEIEKLGGNVQSAVSQSTHYLVSENLEANSSKMKKAKSLGVKIIDANVLSEMLDLS